MSKDEEELIGNLRRSKGKVGPLLPILEDAHGEIIDGFHRQKADENWPRVRLEHAKTGKDRLRARIMCNIIREGVQRGEISKRIAEETGMSYTWVMKYLPDRFKDPLQSERRSSPDTRRVTGFLNKSIRLAKIFKKAQSLKKSRIQIKNYANTHQSLITADRSMTEEWEKVTKEIAKQSGLNEENAPTVLLESMWLTMLEEIKRAVETMKAQGT